MNTITFSGASGDAIVGRNAGRGFELRKILGAKQRSNVDIRVGQHRIRAFLDPLDGFLNGLDLPEPIAGDDFFGFRKRTVRDSTSRSRKMDSLGITGGPEAPTVFHDARLDQRLVVSPHLREQLLGRHDGSFAVLGRPVVGYRAPQTSLLRKDPGAVALQGAATQAVSRG